MLILYQQGEETMPSSLTFLTDKFLAEHSDCAQLSAEEAATFTYSEVEEHQIRATVERYITVMELDETAAEVIRLQTEAYLEQLRSC